MQADKEVLGSEETYPSVAVRPASKPKCSVYVATRLPSCCFCQACPLIDIMPCFCRGIYPILELTRPPPSGSSRRVLTVTSTHHEVIQPAGSSAITSSKKQPASQACNMTQASSLLLMDGNSAACGLPVDPNSICKYKSWQGIADELHAM